LKREGGLRNGGKRILRQMQKDERNERRTKSYHEKQALGDEGQMS
jgi:hypothetical protein